MKIVHVVYSLEMGGAEILVGQLCRIQKLGGHEVSVCAYSNLGVVGEVLRTEGFDIRVLGEANPVQTMWRYFRLFREMEPDVVHCHNVAPTLHAAMSARLAGARRVLSTRHSLVSPPYEVTKELKYSALAAFCDSVVGVCETTCDNLRGAPMARSKKIVRVYNGSTSVDRANTDALAKQGFTLVFVGRLAPEKDLGTLIRAVALVRERMPGLEFWIVGNGRVREELEALTRELEVTAQVRFWGERTDIAQFYSAADAFVMSSTSEGLPMSLLQAMSLGVPAIVTDVGGMAEVVRSVNCGLLSPVGDPAAMGEAIVRLAGDTDLRTEFSKNGAAAYKEHFTLERMADGYMALYQG